MAYRRSSGVFAIIAAATILGMLIWFFVSDPTSPLTKEEMTMDAPLLRETLGETRLKHTRIMKRIAIVLGTINFLSLIAWQTYDYRMKKRREEHYFNIGDNIRELVGIRDRQNEEQSRLLHELLTKEYKAIDEKCRDYYANSSSQSKRKVSDEVIAMVDRFSSDKTIRGAGANRRQISVRNHVSFQS